MCGVKYSDVFEEMAAGTLCVVTHFEVTWVLAVDTV
jgi:hypothetical protein